MTLISLLPYLVLVTLLVFVFNWLWYSPILFGKIWMKEVMGVANMPKQMTNEQKRQMLRSIILGLLVQFVSVTVMAFFLLMSSRYSLEIPYSMIATTVGILWLGFVFPQNMYSFLWQNRRFRVALIDMSASLVSLFISASALAYFIF